MGEATTLYAGRWLGWAQRMWVLLSETAHETWRRMLPLTSSYQFCILPTRTRENHHPV
jgi:hypothetical protein